jgi:hypothetical protein
VLWLGVVAFAIAFGVGVHLTLIGGWPLLAYALLGGAAAIFYVAPPIRWAYRGLGELVIALSYGPWMVLGSLYLHTRAFSGGALLASLVPGCLIMALAVVNAIPDYHQDRLVGKRNLCVRLGRQRSVYLYLGPRGGGDCRRAHRRRATCLSRAVAGRAARLAASREKRPRGDAHLRVAARVRAGRSFHRCLLCARGAAFTAGILASAIGSLPDEAGMVTDWF